MVRLPRLNASPPIKLTVRHSIFLLASLTLPLTLAIASFTACSLGGSRPPERPLEESVGYEIFWRSFSDSDGDGIGDLNGITEKLDTLNDGDPETTDDLGINMIWLTPVFPSPSYHGYDITDYRAVHPDAGTLADLKKLIREAHKRDIRVILDLVVNHTSTEHPWFRQDAAGKPEHEDWYIWRDKAPEGWIGFSGGGPWFSADTSGAPKISPDRRNQSYYALFWDGMPDLNLKNPAVYQEMVETARFWLDQGVDGFRLDAARYIVEEGSGWDGGQADSFETFKFWRDFEADLKETHPHAFCLGEVWASQRIIDRYRLDGNGLDLAFDFSLGNALDRSLLRENRKYLKLYLTAQRESPWSYYAPFWRNHDMDRYMGTLNQDPALAKTGMAALLTLPGIPFLYYGEEIGLVNGPAWSQRPGDPDPAKRSPLPWTDDPQTAGFTEGTPWKAPADPADPFNIAAQQNKPDSLRSLTAELTHLRLAEPALTGPAAEPVGSRERALLAYLRRTAPAAPAASGSGPSGSAAGQPAEGILVLINLSDQPLETNLNFYGTTAAPNAQFREIWNTPAGQAAEQESGGSSSSEAVLRLTQEDYAAAPVTLAPRQVRLLKTEELLTEPLPVPASEREKSAEILITADNRANADRRSHDQIYLYGTFDSIDQGQFKMNNYGDVIQDGYPLYDDGTHGDKQAQDGIYSRRISLMVDYEDPYTLKFGTAETAGGTYIGGLPLWVDQETGGRAPRRVSYTIPPVVLPEPVTVQFTVDMKGVIGASNPGIRGSFTGDSWETHTPLTDDGTDGDAQAGDQIWTARVRFPAGARSYFEYKYNKDGESGWESRGNRSYVIDPGRELNTPGEDIWDQ